MAAIADKSAKGFYEKLSKKLRTDPLLVHLKDVAGNRDVAESIARQYRRSKSAAAAKERTDKD